MGEIRPKRYVVVATMWSGAVIYTPLREVPPPEEYMASWLDDIARRLAPENGGAKPTVRVVEQMASLAPIVVPDAELPEESPPGGRRPTMVRRLRF
jgi:hypothetical protein